MTLLMLVALPCVQFAMAILLSARVEIANVVGFFFSPLAVLTESGSRIVGSKLGDVCSGALEFYKDCFKNQSVLHACKNIYHSAFVCILQVPNT